MLGTMNSISEAAPWSLAPRITMINVKASVCGVGCGEFSEVVVCRSLLPSSCLIFWGTFVIHLFFVRAWMIMYSSMQFFVIRFGFLYPSHSEGLGRGNYSLELNHLQSYQSSMARSFTSTY
ncbi:hypothetical protein K503DRAFT_97479 [Rhizopogon vinicolor AM-OR11-026]|uniref:Uncharacterized protein n=1 Tax=Rhizopogon vinicolor AM-OR11-026 TaxID=1314800 RepID=A0A1B7MFE6_9AGAM|nr:hypothetical protein K503DRAFT_97479 [Rhizopogon vinicolor AM-OR11-026]